jgi:hypothetical protein
VVVNRYQSGEVISVGDASEILKAEVFFKLPNDYKVLTDDSRHVRDVPEGLPADHLLVERDGVITPLRAARIKGPASS